MVLFRFFPLGDFNRWHLTASNIPGFLANSNPLERLNRLLHTINHKKASHEYLLTVGLLNVLKLNSVDRIGISRMLSFVPRCMQEKALEFCENPKNFFTQDVVLQHRHGGDVACKVIFVNTSERMYAGEPVTKARVDNYMLATEGTFKSASITNYLRAGHGLHRVFVRSDADDDCETNGDECDCHRFWQMRTCPHMLAAVHHTKWLGSDITVDLVISHPANRKRGRPAVHK